LTWGQQGRQTPTGRKKLDDAPLPRLECQPLISVEYGATGYNVYGFNKFSLLEWAQANEYAITDLFGNSLQQPATYECCVDSFYWDFFLVPQENEVVTGRLLVKAAKSWQTSAHSALTKVENFEQIPMVLRSSRKLKDAIADGKLRVREMNGSKPNMHTQVMREDLRTFAKSSNNADLLALLKKWDELNPPEAAR